MQQKEEEKSGDSSKPFFNLLIHDYLTKGEYSQTAEIFKNEAKIADYTSNSMGSVLWDWFTMFNDICKVRSGNLETIDPLTRIEAIMVKLENDKSRCNKHPITRQSQQWKGKWQDDEQPRQPEMRPDHRPDLRPDMRPSSGYPPNMPPQNIPPQNLRMNQRRKSPYQPEKGNFPPRPKNMNQTPHMSPYRPIPPGNMPPNMGYMMNDGNFQHMNYEGMDFLPAFPQYPSQMMNPRPNHMEMNENMNAYGMQSQMRPVGDLNREVSRSSFNKHEESNRTQKPHEMTKRIETDQNEKQRMENSPAVQQNGKLVSQKNKNLRN